MKNIKWQIQKKTQYDELTKRANHIEPEKSLKKATKAPTPMKTDSPKESAQERATEFWLRFIML